MDYSSLPKIELHLHLDCSLSYDVVSQLNPDISRAEYRRRFIAPSKCRNLAQYIRYSLEAIALMQTKEGLRLVTEDLFQQLKEDNIIYTELRFAPLEHTQENLSADEVVATVNEAVDEQVRTTGIEAGVILCTLRHYSEKQSLKTVKLVEEFSGTHVVGFDIAADEAGFPIDNHISAFEYANEKNLNITAHAGEARGSDSVWETLKNFKPARIGHGVRSVEDPELLEYIRDNEIHLEICPTSNVQTHVFETIADHSINEIYNSGISCSVNTDGRTLSDVSLSEEYTLLANQFNWEQKQLLNCNLEAIDHAFTDEQTKEKLRSKILEAYSAEND